MRVGLAGRVCIVSVVLGAFVAPSGVAAAASRGGWIYTETNVGTTVGNSVLALQYGKNGSPLPLRIREWPTGGTGVVLVPGKSLGTLAGDGEVTFSSDSRFLFAVNQGSNTISVFRVNKATGALKPVSGSPFPSGGKAPISVAFAGHLLVVANKGILPGEPAPGPGPASYATFAVSSTGKLQPISSIASPGAGPISVDVAPNKRVAFGDDFYDFKQRSFHLAANGQLTEAPGSPATFPAPVTAGASPPPGFPPESVNLPFGITVNPSKPFVYYIAPIAGTVAAFHYDKTGSMSLASVAQNPGGAAACWTVITRDGRFLYTSNSASHNISVFSVSKAGDTLQQIQLAPDESGGTLSNLALDPTNHFLYAVATHDDPDFPRTTLADGNFVNAFRIGADGRLQEIATADLPVPFSAMPFGLAVLGKK